MLKLSWHICRKDELLTLELTTAVELLQWPMLLGDDPRGDQVYMIRTQSGYFYVQRGEMRARIPKVCCLPCWTTTHLLLQLIALPVMSTVHLRPFATVTADRCFHWCANCVMGCC